MYALMPYKAALLTECLITHVTSIRSLNTMYALMCLQMTPFTECLITNLTQIRTLTPQHITGISTFSTVYMELFIHSTLARTQRNIRIYAD
jgi:hypothetical protein